MIDHHALPPWHTLRNLHQPYLHPQTDLVETHGALLSPSIVPPDVILRERDDVLGLVLRSRRHLGRGGPVPATTTAIHARTRAGSRTSVRAQHIIGDVLLVPQIDHRAASTATATTDARTAKLESAPHAPRDAVRLDGDAVVAPVDRPAFSVVHDEDDAASRGERDLARREGGRASGMFS